jgi:hypothetical protein
MHAFWSRELTATAMKPIIEFEGLRSLCSGVKVNLLQNMFDYHSSLKLCSGNLSTNTAFDSSDDAASHISLHVWVDEFGFETKNPCSEQASKLGFGKT